MVKNFSFNVKGNSEPVKWCNFLLKGKLMHFGLTISMPRKIIKKKIHKQTQKNLPSFFTVFIRCQWCLTHFKKHLIHWFLWVFSTIGLCLWKILKRHYLLIAFIQHPFFFVKLHLTSKLHVSWYPQTESVNGRGQRAQLSCAQIKLSVFSVHLSFWQWNDYSDIAFELMDGEKKKPRSQKYRSDHLAADIDVVYRAQ